MARAPRNYAREYAVRKATAQREGFRGVRQARRFTESPAVRSMRARAMERGATRREANAAIRPAAPRGVLDRGFVMAHWEEFDWFDSWEDARDWYEEMA
jgi:hypothetical protein